MRRYNTLLGFVLATASVAVAQTYTDCNPTNVTCTADTGLDQWSFTTNFTEGESGFKKSWTAATGTTVTFGDMGIVFNITDETQAPTISSDFYIFFGQVEVKMQAAPGTGIVSSVVMESDDLDEIDWEWLGGNDTSVESNYFGKGNTTSYDRAIYHDVDSPTTGMHTYTIDWTEAAITWSIDGTAVRTLEYADANGGIDFPQTPLRIKLGNWCGGCSSESEGTIEWAGGDTTFDDAPYIMYVESVKITNYNPALSYNWTDTTGSYDSIDSSNNTSIDTNLNSTTTATTATASATVVTSTNSKGAVTTVTSSASSGSGSGSGSTTSGGSSFSQSTETASSTNTGSTTELSTYAFGVLALAVGFVLL